MRGEWGGLSIPEHQSKVCVGGSGHSRGQHSPAAAPGAGETPGASPGEAQCSATASVHHSFAPCLQEGGNAGSSVVENGGSRCQERGCHGTATAWLRRRGADSSVGGEDRAEPRTGTLQGPHWHGGGFCTSPHRRAPGSDAGSIEGVHPLIPPPRPIPVQSAVLPAHCCLQVESLRILLLAEQALREGLEEALARRSALDLVLSCPGSVPFMQMALGSPRPRLCPFCPASSSGTCPAREGSVRLWQHPPRAEHRGHLVLSIAQNRGGGNRRQRVSRFHTAPPAEGDCPAAGIRHSPVPCKGHPNGVGLLHPPQSCPLHLPSSVTQHRGHRAPRRGVPVLLQLVQAPVTSPHLGSDRGSLPGAGGASPHSHCTAAPWG